MTTEITYIADDGTRFDYEYECEQYEAAKRAEKFKDTALLFDRNGKTLPLDEESFEDAYFLKAVTDEAAQYMAEIFECWTTPWNSEYTDFTQGIEAGCWAYINEKWSSIDDVKNIIKILREIGEEI